MTVKNWASAFAVLIAVVSAGATAGDHAVDGLPDKTLTPGAVDLSITPQNLHSTVCVGGYSKTVRPRSTPINSSKKNVTPAP